MIDGNVYNVGGSAPISDAQFFGALDQVGREMGAVTRRAIRTFHARRDGEALAAHRERHGRLPRGLQERWDSFREQHRDALPAGVTAFPRELEWVRARELVEVRKPLNSKRLFVADTSVPLGARTHTWRRRVGSGEAVVTKGDTENYGHASTGRIEQQFPIIYVLCSVRQTYFEMLSSEYAGLNQYAEDLREARRVVEEKVNSINWSGHTPTGVWGVLNHPSLMKKVLGVTFGGASPTAPATLRASLASLVDAPAIYSGEAMQPDTLAVSPKIYRHISQTQHASGTDTTILEYFLKGQDENNGIKTVTKAQELAGVGPNGEDGLFAYRNEQDACHRVEVSDTMSMPAYQASALSWTTIVFSAIGGVLMPDVGHNILGLASAP